MGGVFYGGLLVAVPMCWWYIRRNGLPLWTTFDLFAPGIALAQGVGRMGCLLGGCCWGQPTEAPWSITFTSPLAAASIRPAGRRPLQRDAQDVVLLAFTRRSAEAVAA